MRLYDPEFKGKRKHFLLQSLAGTAAVVLLMQLQTLVASDVVLASIGATIFIAVATPQAPTSKPRFFVGGYLAGVLSGGVGALLRDFVPELPTALVAGIAVGLCVLAMVVFSVEHPPAAALALGLALTPHTLLAISLALACVTIIAVLLHIFRPLMRNLL
ncbi:MAG: HPP family protein [Coriobacteriales bacterium]|jgi:CBS-domain-containing membrane protein|nr:HPP family protein [Coriobacteriales bacterium]